METDNSDKKIKRIELSLAAARYLQPVNLDVTQLAQQNLAGKLLEKMMKSNKRK
jgi:hypothetical protein